MTRAIGDDEAMVKSLDEVAHLFDNAQNSVFKLMASVCPQNFYFATRRVFVFTPSLGFCAQIHARAQVRRDAS